MTKYAKKRQESSIPEELFDHTVAYMEGKLNRRVERVMKSKLFLAPMGLSWTIFCRSYNAIRHRSLDHLRGQGRYANGKGGK